MSAFKVTMASSSSSPSSICGKPQFLVDKWVRKITGASTSHCNTSMATPVKVVGIRVFMGSGRTNGWTAINGKSREQVALGWRRRGGWKLISCSGHSHFGSKKQQEEDKGGGGSVRSWNFGRRSLRSETTKGLVTEMNSSESREDHEEKDQRDESQHQQGSKLLTLPTILTLGRVAAVPLLVSTFYMTSWWATTVTTSIFVAAAVTDWLDGYLARKMRLGTAFGAFLDPVADKLMVAAALVLLCTRPPEVAAFGDIPWLLPVPAIAIIGREVTMSAVREWAASQDRKVLEAVAVNNLGKWKTATQMTALTILLATRDNSLTGPGVLAASGVTLLYVSAGLAVWSLAVYIKGIWRILVK